VDERTQRLLRTWRESGEGEEDYLRARLRAGEISWVRLETAAYLGDEAAQRILGEDALAFFPRSGLLSWLELLPAVEVKHLYRRVLGAALGALDAPPPPTERALRIVAQGDEAATAALAEEFEGAAVFSQYPPRAENSAFLTAFALARSSLPRGRAAPPFGWQFAFPTDRANSKAVREAVTRELLPAILIEDCSNPRLEDLGSNSATLEAEDRLAAEREARLDPEHEHLFVWSHMSAALAEEVLAAAGNPEGKSLKRAESVAAIEVFALGCGWKRPRSSLVSPSGANRIQVKTRALRFETKEGKAWRKRVAHVGRETLVSDVGRWLLRAARAALEAR
jgi:hypothetical protein